MRSRYTWYDHQWRVKKRHSASNIDSMLHRYCPTFLIMARRVAAKEHRWVWRGGRGWVVDSTGPHALRPCCLFMCDTTKQKCMKSKMYSSTPSGGLVIHLYLATGWITVPLIRPGRPWRARKEPAATVLWRAATVHVTSWLSSLVSIVLPILARLVGPWRRLLRVWTPGAIRVPGSRGGRRRRGTDPSAGTD